MDCSDLLHWRAGVKSVTDRRDGCALPGSLQDAVTQNAMRHER